MLVALRVCYRMYLICNECDHDWNYTGKNKYVNCPSCHNRWTLTDEQNRDLQKQRVNEAYGEASQSLDADELLNEIRQAIESANE